VRCASENDTCQRLRLKNGQMDRDCGRKTDCGSKSLLHYELVDCCEGNNCNGAIPAAAAGRLLMMVAPALLVVLRLVGL